MHMCIILKEWVPGAAFGFGKSSTPVTRLKGSQERSGPNWTVCVVLSGLKGYKRFDTSCYVAVIIDAGWEAILGMYPLYELR